MKRLSFWILGLGLLLTTTSTATTIHVPADQTTIQAGIDAAIDGDTVLVAPGVYTENINFLGKQVKVVSRGGSDSTYLSPATRLPVVTFDSTETAQALFSGFTLQDATTDLWCIQVTSGAAPTITRNAFRNLVSPTIVVCGGASSPTISNNLFYNNRANACIGINGDASSTGAVRVLNNTFDHNDRGLYCYLPSALVQNNIITNNGYYGIWGAGGLQRYNNVWGNGLDYAGGAVPGNGDLQVDPAYVSSTGTDYRLSYGSPCINAGDPNPIYKDPDGSRNDMGAFYFAHVGMTLHVPLDFPTIQAGIDAAVNGDTVLVAPGSYVENLLISGKGIYLLSEGGAGSTSITPATTAENILRLYGIAGKSNTIRGFKFTGEQGMHCIASYNGASITVEECDIVDNIVGNTDGYLDAGAVFVRGTGIIRDNRFINNRGGDHGGGIRLVEAGNSIIERNEFRGNFATYGGGVNLLYAQNVIVRHNLFVADSAEQHGGAIYLGNADNIRMINNTIDSCVSLDNTGGGISFIYCTDDTSFNNIITNCGGYGIWQHGSDGYVADYDDCWSNLPADYFGVTPGAGSISADPRFVGGIPFSYHLKGSSPCINAGNPDPLYNDPDGSRNDMGRYVYTVTIGDANGDGSTDIADVVFLINYIFIGGSAPQPLMAADANCDGKIDIADVVYLINYIFRHGPAPCTDPE